MFPTSNRIRLCRPPGSAILVAFGFWLVLGSIAAAQDAADPLVEVLAADGKTHSGSLKSISDGKIVLAEGGANAELPLNRVLRIRWRGHQAARSGNDTILWLANGDRLFVRPQRMDEEALTAAWSRFSNWTELRVPLETICGFLLRNPGSPGEETDLTNRILEPTERQDVLLLTNGDVAAGQLLGLDDQKFSLESLVGEIQVDKETVRAVVFNPELTSFPAVTGLRAILTLTDGSRLTVLEPQLIPGEKLAARATFGADLEVPLEQVVSLQILGGNAVYLSDIEPADYRFTPYLSLPWPLRRDRNALGAPLSLGGTEYAKGLGTHTRSEISYPLNGQYRRFQAIIGIDDQTEGQGSAVFRVLGDGRELFVSETLRGGSGPIAVGPLDVTGVKILTLVTDFADFADVQDHANWCDALLIR